MSTRSKFVLVLCILVVPFTTGCLPLSTASRKPPAQEAPRHDPNDPDDPGPMPVNSAWDGSVSEVDRELKRHLKDPDSLEYIDWYKPRMQRIGGLQCWIVRTRYRAKNSFGGYNIEEMNGVIRHDKVLVLLRDDELVGLPERAPEEAQPAVTSAPYYGPGSYDPAVARSGSRDDDAFDGSDSDSSSEREPTNPEPRFEPREAPPTPAPAAPAMPVVSAAEAERNTSLVATEAPKSAATSEIERSEKIARQHADNERRRLKAGEIAKLGLSVNWRTKTYEELCELEREMRAAKSGSRKE